MTAHSRALAALLSLVAIALVSLAGLQAADDDPPKDPLDKKGAPLLPEPPAKGKPPGKEAQKGLKFLLDTQNADGGWGGGPSDPFGEKGPKIARPVGKGGSGGSDVAATSIAALALMRAGNSPRQGANAVALRKAIDMVCAEVEKADKASLKITSATGTQIQGKIGQNADTFLAAMMLAQAKGRMPDAKSEARVKAALMKIVDKLEAHQKPDGSWAGEGWAPVVSQALATRALNQARQVGIGVDSEALERTAKHSRENFKKFAEGGLGKGGADGSAGVSLYAAAAHIAALHDAVTTYRLLGETAKTQLRSADLKDEERKLATKQLDRLSEAEKALKQALEVMVKKTEDPAFTRGFGSDGGEEFISFALISEALKLNNRKEYPAWEKALAARLTSSQNGSGSWSGKHCITGETFCTAASLLTLMADRTLVLSEPAARDLLAPRATVDPNDPTKVTRPDLVDPAPMGVAEGRKLSLDLIKANGKQFDDLVAKYRDAKGAVHTEALGRAASELEGDARKAVREALASRLSRMTADTVRRMLDDPEAEVRRAAVLACAMKEDKSFIPDLIRGLADPEPAVQPAARAALRTLTGQDFGPMPTATPAEKVKALQAWRDWWKTQMR